MSKQFSDPAQRWMRGAILGALMGGSLWGASPALAAGCTDGVDCYCDSVSDSLLLYCEDFEDREFYENTPNNWAKSPAGTTRDRGIGSKWVQKYGVGVQGITWSNGTPSSPRIGSVCSPTGLVCGPKEYCSQSQGNLVDGGGRDCWNGNAGAAIDIQRSNDFKDETPTLTLSGGKGATSDVGAGNAHLAHRIQVGKTSGIIGGSTWRPVTEMGVTMANAYSSNIANISLLDDPWKHDEYGDYPYSEYFMMGNVGTGGPTVFPFSPFMFLKTPFGPTARQACEAALARATVLVGSAFCNDVMMRYGATPGSGTGQFTQTTDWPHGTWGCVQAHIRGMGTTDMELKISFNGETLIHIDNFDGRVLYNQDYDEVYWNSYANANQGQGETPATQTAYRYQDNIHIRNGPPVSCAAIGFGTGTTSPPPPPTSSPLPAPVLLP